MLRARAFLILVAAPLWAALAAAALAQGQSPLPLPPAPGMGEQSTVQLSAVFAGEQRPVRSGLVWRLYEEKLDGTAPTLLEKSTAPAPSAPMNAASIQPASDGSFAPSSPRAAARNGCAR